MKIDKNEINVTRKIGGYAHEKIYGECGDSVTVEDIKKRFYHPYFGGRGAKVSDNKFSVIRHTD